MITSDVQQRLDVGRELIVEAGQLALDYFHRLNTLTITSKGQQDMVSEADLAVEHLVRDRLAAAFPTDAFLGEETGATDSDDSTGCWVVDPIDGTQPFLSGLPYWCVSMAYVRGNEVLFGLVDNPTAGELFVGGPGIPATRGGQPIDLHPGGALTDGLTFLGCSARVTADQVVPVLDRLLRAGGMFVRNGSGALGLCDVACGRLLGYVEPHINSWDCLGAVGVLHGTRARVSDFLTTESLLAGGPIVAGPPAVYDALVTVLGLELKG